MSCACCFNDTLCKCIAPDGSIVINTRVDTAREYYYHLTDKFGNVFTGEADVNADGTLSIPVADLPAGLLSQFAGEFELRITYDADGCEPVPLLLAKFYDCITLSVVGGNSVKNSIGCDIVAATV